MIFFQETMAAADTGPLLPYTGVMKSFTPVTSLNISIIYSTEKKSLILFPSCSWNAAKDLDLDLTAQSFFARENRRYSTRGTALLLWGKWSFYTHPYLYNSCL